MARISSGRISLRLIAFTAVLSLLSLLLYYFLLPKGLSSVHLSTISAIDIPSDPSKLLVVAATTSTLNATNWTEELPDWPLQIWLADDHNAPFHTERNKGNEANHYLTYIINNYNNLPDVVVFTHHHSTARHVDVSLQTNANSVKLLRLEHVLRSGYQSLRCQLEIFCVLDSTETWNQAKEEKYRDAWNFLFPDEPCPEVVVAPPSAQFAVSKQAILRRPRALYRKVHQWLMETELQDLESGRVLEYLWHILFGKPAVYCQDQNPCYCQAFGLCEPGPDLGWNPPITDPIFQQYTYNLTINE